MKILWLGVITTLVMICSSCGNHEAENVEPMKVDLGTIEIMETMEIEPTIGHSMDDAPIMDKRLED